MATRKNGFFTIGPFAESGQNVKKFIENIYAMGLYQQTVEQLKEIRYEHEHAADEETAEKLRSQLIFVEQLLELANETMASSFSEDLSIEN